MGILAQDVGKIRPLAFSEAAVFLNAWLMFFKEPLESYAYFLLGRYNYWNLEWKKGLGMLAASVDETLEKLWL